VASRQVANSAWLAELSKIAAKSVTTYKSTSRIIPMIAKICLEGIFVFLFCVFLSCDICIPFVIPIHNSQKSGSAGAVCGSQKSVSAGAVRGYQKSVSAGAVRGSQKLRECQNCPCASGTVRVIRDSQRSRNCVPHVLRWVLESSSVP
jgi:hypothetical protein